MVPCSFRFNLFGDCINTASRMESKGLEGRLHVSEASASHLRASYPAGSPAGASPFRIEPRGVIDVKGKGPMATFFVEWADAAAAADGRSPPPSHGDPTSSPDPASPPAPRGPSALVVPLATSPGLGPRLLPSRQVSLPEAELLQLQLPPPARKLPSRTSSGFAAAGMATALALLYDAEHLSDSANAPAAFEHARRRRSTLALIEGGLLGLSPPPVPVGGLAHAPGTPVAPEPSSAHDIRAAPPSAATASSRAKGLRTAPSALAISSPAEVSDFLELSLVEAAASYQTGPDAFGAGIQGAKRNVLLIVFNGGGLILYFGIIHSEFAYLFYPAAITTCALLLGLSALTMESARRVVAQRLAAGHVHEASALGLQWIMWLTLLLPLLSLNYFSWLASSLPGNTFFLYSALCQYAAVFLSLQSACASTLFVFIVNAHEYALMYLTRRFYPVDGLVSWDFYTSTSEIAVQILQGLAIIVTYVSAAWVLRADRVADKSLERKALASRQRSWDIASSLLPGPVLDDLRSRSGRRASALDAGGAQGKPADALAYSFPSVAMLQSDICGCEGELGPERKAIFLERKAISRHCCHSPPICPDCRARSLVGLIMIWLGSSHSLFFLVRLSISPCIHILAKLLRNVSTGSRGCQPGCMRRRCAGEFCCTRDWRSLAAQLLINPCT